ncbi:MAG: terpene cyclase/mutase family protein [Kiritimatiellae bacterium]|jgi:hypothetical protein|nr:terpene cyclase/mutase family protein [Kiritimatiellia bacterium]
MNISKHIDELDSVAEAQSLRNLTTALSSVSEIEPTEDLTERIMNAVDLDSKRRRYVPVTSAHVFKPWFGAAAAVAVIAVVFGLRFLYPTSADSCSCSLSNEQWLVNSQELDGSWNPERHGGAKAYCPALTALSALALYRSGEDFEGSANSACRYLIDSQQPDGSFGGDGREQLYNQAIVTFVLAETGQGNLARKVALQKAVDFIHSLQGVEGGWDYVKNSQGSAAITSWQVQALSAAGKCGVSGVDISMRKGLRWLRDLTRSDGAVAYNRRSEHTSDTISALAGHALITAGNNFPELSALGERVVASMTHYQSGEASNLYRDCMKVRALKAAGNVDSANILKNNMVASNADFSTDQWVKVGGRLYACSMQALARTY